MPPFRAWTYLSFFLSTVALASSGYRLETYGDSLTAGFLSHLSLMNPPSLKDIGKIMSDGAMFRLTGEGHYIAAHEDKKRAWPNQLADILRRDGSVVEVENHAVTASKAGDLKSQLVEQGSGALAFFFSGHNDLCDNPAAVEDLVAGIIQGFDRALSKWDATHSGSRAILIPMARVDKVFATLKGHVWYHGKTEYRCEDSWNKFFPYCMGFARKAKDGTLEEFVKPRSEALDLAMSVLVDKWNHRSKFNSFEIMLGALSTDFLAEYFSVDCYHLGPNGQAKFAQLIHDSGRY